MLSCDCNTRVLLSTIGTTAPAYCRQNVRQAKRHQTLCPALRSQVLQGLHYHAQKHCDLIRGKLYSRETTNSSSRREVFFSFCLSLGARVRKQFGRRSTEQLKQCGLARSSTVVGWLRLFLLAIRNQKSTGIKAIIKVPSLV